MDNLNYHHLRYFREVAHEGALTRAAERMNVSQSALSTQIRQLEDRLGHALFDRVGRQLSLTEVGRIALDHADRIFGTGEELIATLQRSSDARPPLRVGALSTLSRNFQLQFLRPIFRLGDTGVTLRSGGSDDLFEALKSLALDVVLTTEPPVAAKGPDFAAHLLDEQTVGVHGAPHRLEHETLRDLLANEPLVVPTDNVIRQGFDSVIAKLDVTPHIIADVDDMAMVRLLAREDAGLAIAPSVVLADELKAGIVETAPFDLSISERFYAVTIKRSFPHPVLGKLLA